MYPLALVCLLVSLPVLHANAQSEQEGQPPIEFEQGVQPLLNQHCGACHGPDRQRSGLRLDSAAHIARGGDRGDLFDASEPRQGLLWRALSYEDLELEMPPNGRLEAEELETLARWIDSGAPLPVRGPGEPEEAVASEPDFDLAKRALHWAYQPLAELGGELDVDAHIDRELQHIGLTPAPRADRRTLLRRLSFDLIGLPPTPEETERFLTDPSPGAYERQVERLLESPHFGERWARHWLDLMRYAETRGHEFDFRLPNAHEYRDYLIRAFDADVPLDALMREHVAGDLLEVPRRHPETGHEESILGTGFWFLGDEVHSPVDTRADECDRVTGKIDVLSKAFLGLTVACARCHDHKFDAITTEDFYALSGFAISGSYQSVRFETRDHNLSLARQLNVERARLAPLVRDNSLGELARRHGRLGEYLQSPDGAVREVSPDQELDAAVKSKWENELTLGRGDEAHPFHLFALFSRMRTATPRLIELALRGAREEDWLQLALPASKLVADFSTRQPLLQSGFAFTFREQGETVVGDTMSRPLVGFAPRAAVYFDDTWNVLRPADEAQTNPSGINWTQSGRTLRTETFRLEDAKLFYLIRGSADVFACVDSHRVVHGPLHGETIRSFDAAAGFRWVEHDLREYIGHRIHVEFSPRRDEPGFGLAAVASGTETPGAEEPNELLDRLADQTPSSVSEFASEISAWVHESIEAVARGSASIEALELVDFLWAHPELGERATLSAERETALALQDSKIPSLIKQIRPMSRLAPAMLEGNGVDEHVLIRGSHRSPGPIATRRFLEVFGGKQAEATPTGSGRVELAQAILDAPLFSRVQVNRAWHHLFGRGLVETVDDFGVMGEEPSHPELLDQLARTFRMEGYSWKRLLRRLVTTDAYQRSAQCDPQASELDPTNRFLHRRVPRRLSAEAIRDALLAVSGRLDPTRFGPPVPMHLTEFLKGRGRPESGPLDGAGRRSIYTAVRRNFPVPLFTVFDFPSPAAPVGRRSISNVPAQALTMMNDPFVWQQAEHWARSTMADNTEAEARIRSMYERALSRPPSAHELNLSLGFLEQAAVDDVDAWRDLAHVLLNTKEFLFIR